MALRDETAHRKTALLQDLRDAQRKGVGLHTATPLSQRELSARYELSGRTVSLLLHQLMHEGVLYTLPRVGTFLGRPPMELYLFVTRVPRRNYAWASHIAAMQAGFSDQISQLGGASYALTIEELTGNLQEGNLAGVAGIYLYNVPRPLDLLEQTGVAAVVFEEHELIEEDEVKSHDLLIGTVNYDNEEGGVQATRHLMALGHRNIAFLGLHGNHFQSGEFDWSALRHQGWHQVMQNAGSNPQTLSFLPAITSPIDHQAQRNTARAVAVGMMPFMKTRNITAVVAANVLAAQGLMQVLQESLIPRGDWPALICFDDAPQGASSGISYLRLPWGKIGAEAAQLLWDHQRIPEAKVRHRRLVKMHLVPSLTCRPDWALSGLAHRQVIQATVLTPHEKKDVLKLAAV